MRWSSIHSVASSIFGKAALIISLATPAAKIASLGIPMNNFRLMAAGSILFLIAYAIYLIKVPSIVRAFNDEYSYAEHLISLTESHHLDKLCEFECIQTYSFKKAADLAPGIKDACARCDNIDDFMNEFGDEKGWYYLSLLKFKIYDRRDKSVRLALTALLAISISFINAPSIRALINLYN